VLAARLRMFVPRSFQTRPVLICFAGHRWQTRTPATIFRWRFAGDFEVLVIESLPMRSVAGADSHELPRIWRKSAAEFACRLFHLTCTCSRPRRSRPRVASDAPPSSAAFEPASPMRVVDLRSTGLVVS
jgi:hypothetical protein